MTLLLYIFYIFILIITGYLFGNYFLRSKINFFENFGISIGLGLVINFINVSIFSLLRIEISPTLILAGFVLWLSGLFLWSKISGRQFWGNNFKKEKFDIFSIGVFLLIGIIFFILIYSVMSVGFNNWDEFSFWGKAARMTFVNKDIFINKFVTVEGSGQPIFWPASTGSMAIFAKDFVENYLKLMTLSIFASFCVFLYGYMIRFKFSVIEKLLFVLLFVSSSQIVLQLSTNLYADIPFMYFYSIATLLVLFMLNDQDANNSNGLWPIVTVFLATMVFIKRGGSILGLISLFSFLVVNYKAVFKTHTIKWLKIINVAITILALQFVWNISVKFLGEITSPFMISRPFEFVGFGLSHLSSILPQVFLKLNNRYFFTTIWFLYAISTVLGVIFYKSKEYYYVAIFTILNIAYLIVAYLVMFSVQEMTTLGSFERYVVAFIPVCFSVIIIFYRDIKEKVDIFPNEQHTN